MVDIPSVNGEKIVLRDANGRLLPGSVINPNGRPAGSQNMPNLGGPLTNEIMAKIETYSKGDLLNLIRKVGGAIWGVGIMTDDEAYEAARMKLLHTGLTSESANTSLNTLREWIDRTKGRAVQRVEQKVEHSKKEEPPQELSNEQLFAMIASASTAGLLPAGVKVEGGAVVTDADYSEVSK